MLSPFFMHKYIEYNYRYFEESTILADNKIEESYIYLKSEEVFYVF